MNEQTTKEKLREYLEEDACYSDSDFILSYFDEALDIAISSERERIIQEVEKEYKQSDNLQSARVVLRDLLKRLKVKSKSRNGIPPTNKQCVKQKDLYITTMY
jgi:CBS-domain-containing membrane protein